MTLLTWINHSGFQIESKSGKKLISDPWLNSSILNNSWDLLVQSAMRPDELGAADALWFSHEHPDHFAPGTLKQIPESQRGDIKVFYRETRDKKVINFCEKMGFQIQEMKPKTSYEIGGDPTFSFTVNEVPFYDSFFDAKVDGLRILNLNDCVIKNYSNFCKHHKLNHEFDIVFVQFGYANWTGNPDEKEKMMAASLEKLDRIYSMDRHLKPKYIALSACFTFFSNSDNFFFNQGLLPMSEVFDRVQANVGAKVISLYPGDKLDLGELPGVSEFLTQEAIKKYDSDHMRIHKRGPIHSPVKIEKEQLHADFEKFKERVLTRNSAVMIRLFQFLRIFPKSVNILLDDERTVEVSYYRLRETSDPWDIKMSSDMLQFIFKFDFGYDSLEAGGRFTVSNKVARAKIFMFFGGWF